MKKYIHMKRADREFIAKALGITERTIFNATHFADMSEGNELAQKVRKLVMDRGGIIMMESPEAEVFHDADGYMRNYLPNGTLLELSKETGCCDVLHKGERVAHYDDVHVVNIKSIQDFALSL